MKTTMKNLILLILAIFLTNPQVFAGEVYWQTQENTFQSRQNCSINGHSHNDTLQVSEFWLDCGDNNIKPIKTGPVSGRSIVNFAGEAKLICKVDVSQFGRNDDFFLLLDCQQPSHKK